jgi:glycosidase
MKRHLLLAAVVAQTFLLSAKPVIDHIEPADWYVGMKVPQLQLMVYGKDVRAIRQVTTDYPGVTIDSLVRLDSPNYLFIYIDLSKARPGTMKLQLDGRQVSYSLKQREMDGEARRGFTNADVLYMLMPDRFAQGKNHPAQLKGMRAYREDRTQPSLRHGGDLAGIREHLDYFCDLGVTALWLTPVLENNSPDDEKGFSTYHGYATTDYYRVDPRFGTNADYRRLVDEAHDRGLKVVMDMIFNHCGIDHPWVSDLPSNDWLNAPEGLIGKNNTASAYLQTSYKLTPVLDPYAAKVDLRETVEGWFVPTMPDLNQHNPHLMRYLIQNAKWWIETIGIDGIRMDTYPYAFADGMAEWMKEMNDEYPHFNTVGETWVTEPPYTAAWQDIGDNRLSPANAHPSLSRTYLKTVMDFSFFDKWSQAKTEDTDLWWQGLNRIYNSFVYDYLYPNPSSVMAFIENHDTDRFLGEECDTLMLKQALALLLTVNRIPQLYYGTEVLMNGTKTVTDGNVRKDFPGGFPGDVHDCFTPEGRTDAEQQMFLWLRRLLHWRQNNPLIIKGRQTQFIPYHGVYVVARQLDKKDQEGRTTSLTILNGTSQSAVMQVERYAEVIEGASHARDVLTGRDYDLQHDVQLQPRQSLVLEF